MYHNKNKTRHEFEKDLEKLNESFDTLVKILESTTAKEWSKMLNENEELSKTVEQHKKATEKFETAMNNLLKKRKK